MWDYKAFNIEHLFQFNIKHLHYIEALFALFMTTLILLYYLHT